MSCITTSVITHDLNIGNMVKPITQRKKIMGDEKKLIIKVELGKLVDANFVKEIRF